MDKQRIWGETTVFGCNDIEVGLHHEAKSRWLNFCCWSDGHKSSLSLFFESQQDQDAVIQQLYSELGKLQPKF